jgi:molecular chaperone DnaK
VPILGLDFGTSTSVAAFFDDKGELHRVRIRDDVYTMPSVVSFHGGYGDALVGDSAVLLQLDQPESTIVGVKRFLGRRFHSDYVGRYAGRISYNLWEGEGGRAAVKLGDDILPLEEVAAKVIARLRELATVAAGEEISKCVLACPAHFLFRQREALREAARIAGLEVVAMINEPTAAAVAQEGAAQRTVLVYDLGGGTFDTTILRVDGGVVEVLGTGGDAFLGGNEFDEALMRQLADRFRQKTGADLRDSPAAEQRLAVFAENAKIELSTRQETRVRAPCLVVTEDTFLDLDETVTRKEFEALTDRLIERTIGIAMDTVKDAGLGLDDLDEVLLIGGQCEMPRLRERVAEVFGDRVERSLNARESVAIGAARAAKADDLLLDVISVPLCAMWPGAAPGELVRGNTPIPARGELRIGAHERDLPVIIYEAMSPTSIDREILGKVSIPPSVLDDDAKLVASLNADYSLEVALESKVVRLVLDLVDPERPKPASDEGAPEPIEVPVGQATDAEINIASSDGAESLVGVWLDRFLVGVNEKDMYRALDIEPLTPTPKALARVSELGRAFKKATSQEGPDQRRAVVAFKILKRVAPVLRAPDQRVRYDLSHGHIYADERLKRAGEDVIFDQELLRSSWRGLNPANASAAAALRKSAALAESMGDQKLALETLNRALELDPFDVELRAMVSRLSGQA